MRKDKPIDSEDGLCKRQLYRFYDRPHMSCVCNGLPCLQCCQEEQNSAVGDCLHIADKGTDVSEEHTACNVCISFGTSGTG